MNRAAVAIYLLWALMLVFTGIFIMNKITNTSDPTSLSHRLKQLKETIDENPEVP